MKYVITCIALGAGFGAGWCGATIHKAVAEVTAAAAIRDATEDYKAGRRQAWHDGTLFANTTTVRKTLRLPKGFSIIGEL